jgi:Rab GTPase-activating protein 1
METTKTEVRNGDDNLSLKSSDSQTTSGEYEIVPVNRPVDLIPSGTSEKPSVTSPILDLPNRENMEDLEKKLTEVIFEQETATLSDTTPTTTQKSITQKVMIGDTAATSPSSTLLTPDVNKVGQSVFYDCLDMSPLTEKQDDMKPEKSDTEEEMSDIDQECTVFSGVTYLGAANINSPKSEPEIYRTMDELNSISGLAGLKVAVSIPTSSEGLVVLYDAESNAVVAHYEINRIRYFAYGLPNSSSEACFAFTWSHSESLAAIYQCHVFRCSIPEAVTQVNACFIRAFQRIPSGMQSSMTGSVTSAIIDNTTQNLMMTSVTSDITGNPLSTAMYEFNVSLEVREKVTKNTSAAVPRDRGHFKLRCHTDKEVCIVVKQIQSEFLPPLFIERCFGVLLSPGRLVRQADMQLLDMVSMGYVKPNAEQTPTTSHMLTPQHLAAAHAAYQIRVEWKAHEKGLEQLNAESPKMYVTVAVDLVIKGIQEPVRFVIETQAMILAQNESRIMDNLFSNKRPLMLKYYLQLKEVSAKRNLYEHANIW